MPGLNEMPSREEVANYIRMRASSTGLDPDVALRVAASEGLNADPAEAWQSSVVKDGKRERSYGPFQLYIDGGLGNSFMDETGLDPRDGSTWQPQVDYALAHAANNGWGSWYGAANTGIGDFEGISGRTSVNPANMPSDHYGPGPYKSAGVGHEDVPPSFMKDEYADNLLGRWGEKRDQMRAGLGEKLGLDVAQMDSLGAGLQGLGNYMTRGGFG